MLQLSWNFGLPATPLKLNAGDKVVFRWSALNHNVVELPNRAAFDQCDFTHKKYIIKATPSGAGNVVGNNGKVGYYVCTILTHCKAGLKRMVVWGDDTSQDTAAPTSSGSVACTTVKKKAKCNTKVGCVWKKKKCRRY